MVRHHGHTVGQVRPDWPRSGVRLTAPLMFLAPPGVNASPVRCDPSCDKKTTRIFLSCISDFAVFSTIDHYHELVASQMSAEIRLTDNVLNIWHLPFRSDGNGLDKELVAAADI